MSYNSKKTVASMLAGMAVAIAYAVYALGESAPPPENIRIWAGNMLVFIGIGVAAVIVLQILLHVGLAASIAAKEKDKNAAKRLLSATTLEDERDKAVSRRRQ